MDLRIELSGKAEDFRYDVYELIRSNDEDFVEPFSEREEGFKSAVDGFIDDAHIIRCLDSGEMVGFLIFTYGGFRNAIASYCPCLYVNLALVEENYRCRGICTEMYEEIIDGVLPDSDFDTVGVRTHEINEASRLSIENAGFEEKARETEDGEKLIYFVYES